jgi:hypothetical protein
MASDAEVGESMAERGVGEKRGAVLGCCCGGGALDTVVVGWFPDPEQDAAGGIERGSTGSGEGGCLTPPFVPTADGVKGTKGVGGTGINFASPELKFAPAPTTPLPPVVTETGGPEGRAGTGYPGYGFDEGSGRRRDGDAVVGVKIGIGVREVVEDGGLGIAVSVVAMEVEGKLEVEVEARFEAKLEADPEAPPVIEGKGKVDEPSIFGGGGGPSSLVVPVPDPELEHEAALELERIPEPEATLLLIPLPLLVLALLNYT